MPIPRLQVPVKLVAATPTAMTVETLKAQLTAIGLTCPDSAEALLPGYIAEVETQLPVGQTQSYAILSPAVPTQTFTGHRLTFHEVTALAMAAGNDNALTTTLADSATGNWTVDPTGDGYGTTLEYIQFQAHFDWLKANRPSFTGISDAPPMYTGRYNSIDAVKQLFVTVGTTASATLLKGLDPDTVEAMLTNVLAPLNDSNASNYNPGPDSRVLFLVENYNPQTQEADGIGVLTIWWNLTIKDYKAKSKDATQHDTTLEIKSWSVLYSSLDAMNADYAAAKAQFNPQPQLTGAAPRMFAGVMGAIPPGPGTVTIFDTLPAANATTFSKALPTLSTSNRLSAIVLYAPDLENIGSIDNTTSQATTTYSQSVTSGFTFSTTQTLSVTASLEVTIEVVKASLTVGFSISFTEEWSSSKTTTIEFSVPPGQKAFTYQGFLLAAVIYYDASSGAYSYGPVARFVTDILATSNVPLAGPSKFTQPALMATELAQQPDSVTV